MCPCVVSFLPLLPSPPLTLSTGVAPATKWNVLQLIDCSPLRSIPITGTSSLLWVLLTSHSSFLLQLMGPPVRPPRLRCALFPLIHLPHLLVLPTTFGLQCLLPPYPHFPALYAIPVRQAKGLPTRTRDLHPLERAHGAQTKGGVSDHRNLRQFFLLFICFRVSRTDSVRRTLSLRWIQP